MASRYKRAKDEEWKANFEFLPLPNSKVIRTPTNLHRAIPWILSYNANCQTCASLLPLSSVVKSKWTFQNAPGGKIQHFQAGDESVAAPLTIGWRSVREG